MGTPPTARGVSSDFLERGELEGPIVAVLVTGVSVDATGAECTVLSLGSKTDAGKVWGATRFNRRKELLHLCRTASPLDCKGPEAVHVHMIGFWPVRAFNGDGLVQTRELRKFWDDLDKREKAPDVAPTDPGGEPGALAKT